jgi:cobalt-zinc-cadmium resistance protein CzcA
MPKLEEGNFWIRATLPTSISLDKSASYVGRMRRILRGCPDDDKLPCTEENRSEHGKLVTTVVSQLGRPDDGTDVAQFNNIEFFAPLAPFDDWPRGLTKAALTDEMNRKLQEAFPGVVFNFSQYISDNVEEALSGVKGENSVKVMGPDIVANEKLADEIMSLMSTIQGVTDLGMFRTLGQPNIKIVPDRAACARYGLNTGDIDNVITASLGGQAITNVCEGEKFFALTVRWLEPYRRSLESIREINVTTPDGNYIPLGQLARITVEDGPTLIYREDGFRYAPVKFSVRGRDLKSTIAEAKQKIADNVQLPYDTHLEWAGQIGELNDAMDRLTLIVPITLLLIAFLTFSAVKNWVDTLIVIIDIPVACTGGVLALLVTSFSVSAAMGFISIFGIAIQDAILVVTYFQRLREDQGRSIVEAAREAAEKRFRPVLMTTLVATLGLLPAALSNGIGAQTQKPLAVVVIGGSLILAILTRILQPPLLVMAHEWMEKRRPPAITPAVEG